MLILAFQTDCSCQSEWPLTAIMSQIKEHIVFLHPHSHPKEWMPSGAEARRPEEALVGSHVALLLASEGVCMCSVGRTVT